ncbi:MAG TPA: DUF2785 domain-containing protein [Kofleriaceae bacterium]|nr:DUF2785 domain-containing protein [Kofleriaceae bacterium]
MARPALAALALVLALALAACRTAAAPQSGRPGSRPVDRASAVDDAALARWRGLLGKGAALPPPAEAGELLRRLEPVLADPDPARRDGIAYEVYARLLLADGAVTDADVAALRDRLVARTAAEPVAGDAVFGRSFAALVLSVIAAREVAHPAWDPAALDAQIAAATAYAAREVDLRGYTGATGWAHAAAHTADWLKFLARHPALTSAQAVRLLDGVTSLVARAHGTRFAWGEDERLAAAARAVLRRGLVDEAGIDAWLARVGAPLASGWPDPFDARVFATQRNARDLLVSLFVALSFDDAAPAAAALARLRAFMAS